MSHFATLHQISHENEQELYSNDVITSCFLSDLSKVALDHPWEKIAGIVLISEEFTMENNLLNSSGKKNRKVIFEKYSQILTSKFKEMDETNKVVFENLLQNLLEGKVDGSRTFREMGGDSLMAVNFLASIRKHFKIEISIEDVYKYKLSDLLVKIQSFVPVKTALDPSQDSILPFSLDHVLNLKKSTSLQNILVTGSTGFIGPFLVHQILKSTDINVFLLIRGANQEEIETKFWKSCEKSRINKKTLEDNDRIHFVKGELEMDEFGCQEYKTLSESIDVVLHMASQVNLVYSYADLKKSNVDGTLQIIKFATTSKLKTIHYISSTDVFGVKDPRDFDKITFPESFEIPTDYLTTFSGYGISKWVAERLLVQSQSFGVPVTIIRLGSVSGDEENGVGMFDDFLGVFLTGILKLKAYPRVSDEKTFTSFVPVSYVSHVVVEIIQGIEKFDGKAFHVLNPNGKMMLKDLMAIFDNIGFKEMDYVDWVKLIDSNNPLYHHWDLKSDHFPVLGRKRFENRNVEQYCHQDLKNYPELMRLYLQYFASKSK